MSDREFQNLSTVQSNKQLNPPTIASATTVSITSFLTFLTGTAQLTTINAPTTGLCMICLIFTNGSPGAFLTTGNINAAVQPVQNIPVYMVYDPASANWYGFATDLNAS